MYCGKCGKELADNQEICEECKKTIVEKTEEKVVENIQNENKPKVLQVKQRKKCCPKCKSRNMQIVTNTEFHSKTKGGGYSGGKGCCGYMALGPLGLLCGACGSKSKTTVTSNSTNVWICRDCGNKFRDVEDIDRQIDSMKRNKTSSITVLIIIAVIVLIVLLEAISADRDYNLSEILIYLLYGIPAAILVLSQILSYIKSNNAIECLKLEKEDVEENGYIDE